MAQAKRRLPRVNIPKDAPSVRKRLEMVEKLMERSFTLPGTRQQFGLDVILDVIPVVGDVAGAAIGSYMIWEARNLNMSKWQMSRMAGNVGVDFLLGLIPFVGVIPDFFFKSNSRNLKIIKRHLDKHHAAGATVEGKAKPLP
jgi:hypothetical protein